MIALQVASAAKFYTYILPPSSELIAQPIITFLIKQSYE
jgi:hypothetical protein